MAVEILRGVSVPVISPQLIPEQVLNDVNIDCIAIIQDWSEFEPTEGVYDTDYIVSTIQTAVARGKKIQITISTMAGSATFGGNTPDWVFTAIGDTEAGNNQEILDGVTTNGDPTVTAASGNFSDADLFREIQHANIPSPSYIGLVNSATSIELSSSDSSNVPVNATGSGTGLTLTIPGRPKVAFDTYDQVFGASFTYNDLNPNHPPPLETTIPVFWEPTFLKLKKQMLNQLGINLAALLTPAELAAVAVTRIAYANSQTEDWSIPVGIDPNDPSINWDELWLNPTTGLVYADRGHGYTTQKMIDAAVKQASQAIPGQIFTNERLVSTGDYFTLADLGKAVTGTGLVLGTTIQNFVSKTEVDLNQATLSTASITFTIVDRDTGLFDVAMAALPDALIESAISHTGPVLNAEAAEDADDPDVHNYLARTVCAAVNAKYPGRFVATKNQTSAVSPVAPPTGTGGQAKSWALLLEISSNGFMVAGQDVWHAYNDPGYRMNGGSSEDKDNPGTFLTDQEISDKAGTRLFGYGAIFREMYLQDALGLPESIAFSHDLFQEGGSLPPPPAGPTEGFVLTLTGGLYTIIGALEGGILTSDARSAVITNLQPSTPGVPRVYHAELYAFNEFGAGIPAEYDFTAPLGQEKANPCGIYHLLLAPGGDWWNSVVGAPALNFDYIVGFRGRSGINNIQPTFPVGYEWDFFDLALDNYITPAGKKLGLSVGVGVNAPAWWYDEGGPDEVAKIAIDLADITPQAYQPVFWDPKHLEKMQTWITAQGTKWDGHESISYWVVGGFMQDEAGYVSRTAADDLQWDTAATDFGYANKNEAYMDAAIQIIEMYIEAFPNTTLYFTSFKPWKGTDGAPALSALEDYIISSTNHRVGIIRARQAAEQPWDPPFQGTYPQGAQAVAGSNNDVRFYLLPPDPYPVAPQLMTDFIYANLGGIQFHEVYTIDINNTLNEEIFDEGNALLCANLPE